MKFNKNCVTVNNNKIISLKEKGRVFVLYNNKCLTVRIIKIDNCIIKNLEFQKACDYGVWIETKNLSFLVELKGKNIIEALRQLIDTIKFIKEYHKEEIRNKKIKAVIIPSKNNVPRYKQTPDYIKLKKMIDEIFLKENKIEIKI